MVPSLDLGEALCVPRIMIFPNIGEVGEQLLDLGYVLTELDGYRRGMLL